MPIFHGPCGQRIDLNATLASLADRAAGRDYRWVVAVQVRDGRGDLLHTTVYDKSRSDWARAEEEARAAYEAAVSRMVADTDAHRRYAEERRRALEHYYTVCPQMRPVGA